MTTTVELRVFNGMISLALSSVQTSTDANRAVAVPISEEHEQFQQP